MKAGIQELLSGERMGTVRRALAMAAAAMARICVPANQWPSLLPWLHGCTQSPSEAQRETALMLICSLIETIGGLPPHTVYSAKLSQIQSDESAPPTSQGIHSRCQAVRHTKEAALNWTLPVTVPH